MTAATREGVGLAAHWRLLALGFTAPTEETLAEVEILAEALIEADPSPELEAFLQAVRGSVLEETAAQYAALFRGKVLVAPYEGSYEVDPIRQGRQMADVAAFYRAFGAEANGPGAERPDFVGCELEFLSFLELRRLAAVDAEEDGVETIDRIAASFLADHAGRWLPTFYEAVADEAPRESLFAALCALGSRVLADELTRRSIAPTTVGRRTRRSPVERDDLVCAATASTLSR